MRRCLVFGFLMFLLVSVQAVAGPVSSRSIPNDVLASPQSSPILVVPSTDAARAVFGALSARGYSRGEIEGRLSQLSPEDLNQLSGHLDQLQAAGLSQQKFWIGVGILAPLVALAVFGGL